MSIDKAEQHIFILTVIMLYIKRDPRRRLGNPKIVIYKFYFLRLTAQIAIPLVTITIGKIITVMIAKMMVTA